MEMKHLFKIYQDSIFLDQMKIWSSYAEGKPMKTKRTDLRLKGFQHGKKTPYSKKTNSYTAIHEIDTIGYWNEKTIENNILKKIKTKKRKSLYSISTDSLKTINYIILKNEVDFELKKIAIKNKKGKWETMPINSYKNSLYRKNK